MRSHLKKKKEPLKNTEMFTSQLSNNRKLHFSLVTALANIHHNALPLMFSRYETSIISMCLVLFIKSYVNFEKLKSLCYRLLADTSLLFCLLSNPFIRVPSRMFLIQVQFIFFQYELLSTEKCFVLCIHQLYSK